MATPYILVQGGDMLTYPSSSMTAATSQSCTASSSTVYSTSYPAWHAFSTASGHNDGWISKNGDTSTQWIQLLMPEALYDIQVTLKNRENSNGYVAAPKAYEIWLFNSISNDTPVNPLKKSFTNTNNTSAAILDTNSMNNLEEAYKYVRIVVTSRFLSSYCAIGLITIQGTNSLDGFKWQAMTPYIAGKTTFGTAFNPAIAMPSAGMTANSSQNCTVSTSGTYSTSYPAWRAFDGKTATAPWASPKSSSDTQYIQLYMSEPLYNISVTIWNRGDGNGAVNGPISGTISGSNDGTNFSTLTTFSGRDGTTKLAKTTHNCNNTTAAYQYVKIQVETWYQTSSNKYCAIGEINITGYEYDESQIVWKPAQSKIYNGEWV